MRLLNRTRVLAALFVLLAVALLPPLFNMSRYRAGVANAIARALGRRVTVGEVHLRLFPQPGFTLTNLVVEDEPSFGAEPALLAGEVTADLRITSLWRGRLEIAQLSLNYPSLNLVRRSDGHWNLESLLERTTHSGAAPTGKNKPEARTRFPYIEVKNGRINLKIGQEKKAYALSDADFALWLASEGEWRVRLEARPVRTDDNLSDTGSIRLSGNFGTAPRLSDTPLSLQLTLEDAQLGQFTRLIYGRDRGWRGALNAVVQMRGTPAAVLLDANLWADNFHRFDIPTGDGFKLSATCKGRMGSLTESLEDINCTSEVGDGKLTIQGNAQWASQRLGFHLNASAKKIPAEPLLLLVRRMKKDVPPDLSAAGTLDASVEVAVAPGSPWIWSGSGSTSDLVLKSGLLPRPLELGELQLQMLSSASSAPGQKPSRRQGASRRQESSRRESSHRAARKSESLPQEPTLAILPFPVPLGETSSARSQAWVTASGYRVTLAGDADAGESLSLARALGLSAPAVPLQGIARFNFEVSGTWQGFQAPQITGSAHLRSVTARIDGIGSPLLIESGTLAVSPSESILRDARFSLLNSRLQFSGWVQKPRFCVLGQPTGNSGAVCQLKFQLDAGQLAMQDILELLKPVRTKTAWFGLLPSNRSQNAAFVQGSASGRITAKKFALDSLTGGRLASEMDFNAGVLSLKNLRADILHGHHLGDLTLDFRGELPAYAWHGELRDISVDELADFGIAPWTNGGKLTLRGAATSAGGTKAQIIDSVAGAFDLDWQEGTLPGFGLDAAAAGTGIPLLVRRFTGKLDINKGVQTFSAATLTSGESKYLVSGAISPSRALKLELIRANAGKRWDSTSAARNRQGRYIITGSVDRPVVSALGALPVSSGASSGNRAGASIPSGPPR